MYKWIVLSRSAYYNARTGNLPNNAFFWGGGRGRFLLSENKDDINKLDVEEVIDKCYFNKRVSCYGVFSVLFIHKHNVVDFYFKS
jgi:hypothetical protein